MSDAEIPVRDYPRLLLQHFVEALTEWEDDFCRSVSAQLAAGRSLSDKQEDVLHRIMARVAGEPRGERGDG